MEARQEDAAPDFDAALDDDVGDDLLRLIFTACHPVLSTEARVTLTLKLLAGLTTEEIARAFLVDRNHHSTAHRPRQAHARRQEGRLRSAERRRAVDAAGVGARSHLPDLQRRLFGDGRRRLDAAGALRGRAAAGPRARGPRAERAGSARPGRADGDPGVAIGGARRAEGRADPADRSGSAAMESAADPARPHRAGARGTAAAASAVRTRCRRRSPPAMRARGRPIRPTGQRIASLYDELATIMPSPIVELNRAVAYGMAFGPEQGPGDRRAAGRRAGAQRAIPTCRACAPICCSS